MDKQAKILVVDDEDLIIDILRRRFERMGFDVFTAQDGENAIQFLNNAPVDLVVCDVKIPAPRTAEDVLRISQSKNPDSKFVAISGSMACDESVQSIIEAGADLFIKKPFTSLKSVASDVVKILNR